MQAPKYIETDQTLKWSRDHALLIHQKRLNEIKAESSKISSLSGISKKSRIRPQRFLEVERSLDIKKHNQLLLERLVEISIGRKRKEDPMSNTQSTRSLNRIVRKKEAEKILNENEWLARRLAEQKPRMMSKKKLDEEYSLFREYKTRLSKLHYLKTNKKPTERSAGSLPQIEREKVIRTTREGKYKMRSQTPDILKKKSYLSQRTSSNSPIPKKLSPTRYKPKDDQETGDEKPIEYSLDL
ncbi:unnamed protein product [Blepharisma stoltei]|uniref:Protein FAM161A n=1 Tax=Blepharisma stoltei TaxID=1481888 RepID=A0AAU9JEA5_9CILI|nr:unnamed protein product [Blepharisma stoltei]